MGSLSFRPDPSDHFAPAYRRFVRSVVHEPAPVVRPAVRERLLRCLWFDQEFDEVLRTEAGRKLTVLSPGWWNLEAGPDFKNAAIRFSGGKPVKGSVEVHVDASGWQQHGHHQDPAYNDVILHVVMWNDSGSETTCREDGRAMPILALDRYVKRSVDELTDTLNPAEYPHASEGAAGRCQELLAQNDVDPEWIGQFLDHAGDERMLRKAERFRDMPEGDEPETILYVSLMEAAGFKNNKRPMGRLARLVPLPRARELLERGGVVSLQAALFGMAGLIPEQFELPGAEPDRETAAYVGQLRAEWAELADGFDGRPLEPEMWSFSGTRPVNYPTRRIAGIARLLEKVAASGGLVAAVEDAVRRAPAAPSRRIARGPAAKAVVTLLTDVWDEFWSWRTTFSGRKLRHRTRLIGKNRATILFVDAIVPILLARARQQSDRDLEKRLHRAYATLPRLPDNSVLRFMASRIFGGTDPAGEIVTSARRQQGLLQLFRDYCEREAEGCRHCAFAEALESS
ncbi:MAG: DUF2851 family protein [Planctomycetota bacterium]